MAYDLRVRLVALVESTFILANLMKRLPASSMMQETWLEQLRHERRRARNLFTELLAELSLFLQEEVSSINGKSNIKEETRIRSRSGSGKEIGTTVTTHSMPPLSLSVTVELAAGAEDLRENQKEPKTNKKRNKTNEKGEEESGEATEGAVMKRFWKQHRSWLQDITSRFVEVDEALRDLANDSPLPVISDYLGSSETSKAQRRKQRRRKQKLAQEVDEAIAWWQPWRDRFHDCLDSIHTDLTQLLALHKDKEDQALLSEFQTLTLSPKSSSSATHPSSKAATTKEEKGEDDDEDELIDFVDLVAAHSAKTSSEEEEEEEERKLLEVAGGMAERHSKEVESKEDC
ncbi:hypothetical protein QOT17_017853 [Balamuthia mandrillaris]